MLSKSYKTFITTYFQCIKYTKFSLIMTVRNIKDAKQFFIENSNGICVCAFGPFRMHASTFQGAKEFFERHEKKQHKGMTIFDEIKQERKRQDQKWGQQNHSPIEWCAILGEEVGEVQKAALEHHFKHAQYMGKNRESIQLNAYRIELIQVAAVAVSMIESLDRNELKEQ